MDEESRVFENNKNPHKYVSWIKKFNRLGSKYLVTCGKQRTHILLDKRLNKEFYTDDVLSNLKSILEMYTMVK